MVSSQALAFKVFEDQDKGISVNVGVLVQPWIQMTGPLHAYQGSAGIGAPSSLSEGDANNPGLASNPSLDLFLRRARLIVSGTAFKDLGFFFSVDQPDIGSGASFGGVQNNTKTFYIQDAFLTYQLAPEFKIDAGMMSVPFARHTIEGAGTLNWLDFHTDVMRFPTGKAYHDTGLQFRGTVGDAFNYRLGVFEGVRNLGAQETPVEPVGAFYPDLNKNGMPRFTGQLRYNLAGTESDFFLKGIYFSPTPVVSIGVGADYQPNAVLKLEPTDPGTYSAFSADLFVEYPFSADDEVIFKANAFQYGEGWSRIEGQSLFETGGISGFAEAGFRHAWIEPVFAVDFLKAKASAVAPITRRDQALLAYHGGANFWIDKHTFNIKLDFGMRQRKIDGRRTQSGSEFDNFKHEDLFATLQGQVFF
jgi:Phosphate-selective porin O and P